MCYIIATNGSIFTQNYHLYNFTLQDSEEEEEEEIVHEETCAVCGAADNLVDCFTCVSAFHLDCHEPPLRHFPRQDLVGH